MTVTVLEAYQQDRSHFEHLRVLAISDIEAQLSRAGLKVHHVTGRLKKPESLAEKLRRKPNRYRTLADVTDVVALRVITYFERDVWQVSRLLERHFEVDWDHSVDKSKAIDPDRFGYMGVHYVVRFGARRADVLGAAAQVRFEVQIRSILQHAWAEIEHDLGYKTPGAVPREIRRRFSRLAGLLEIADEEFMAIDRLSREYAAQLPERISQESDDVFIDAPSVAYLIRQPDVAALDSWLAGQLDTQLLEHLMDDERPQRIASTLQLVGVHSVGQFLREFRRSRETLEGFGKHLLAGVPETWEAYGGLRPGVGAACYALWRACATPGVNEREMLDLMDLSRGSRKGQERLLRRTREAYDHSQNRP